MTIKDLTQDALFNQTKYQVEPITEDELIKSIGSGFVSIDEIISGAGLNEREADYLKDHFSSYEPEPDQSKFDIGRKQKRFMQTI